MDSLINAAARALAAGNPLAALDRVALRNDPPGLALRGIAMAQLGELVRARELLSEASLGFGDEEPLARARCTAAAAEVTLALRELDADTGALRAAIAVLVAYRDRHNAAHAHLTLVRRHILLGEIDDARSALEDLELTATSPVVHAIGELLRADMALRGGHASDARAALMRARGAATKAGVDALRAEINQLLSALAKPAARVVRGGNCREATLSEVEALRSSSCVIIDGCRRLVHVGREETALTSRPVLFVLARTLAAPWPADVSREELILSAFGARRINESHRVRLRVEIGRLRKELRAIARIDATKRGFVLKPVRATDVVVLLPPVDGPDAALVALLADGGVWSTTSLALALGVSKRTVQRALIRLRETGRARALGRARSRRWLAPPISAYTTALLLPGAGVSL